MSVARFAGSEGDWCRYPGVARYALTPGYSRSPLRGEIRRATRLPRLLSVTATRWNPTKVYV